MHSDRQAEVASAAGTIAFIGGGNMARSLIGGLLARGRELSAANESPAP